MCGVYVGGMTLLYRIAYATRVANPIWLYLAAVLIVAPVAIVVATNPDGVLALPGAVFDTMRDVAYRVATTIGGVLPW